MTPVEIVREATLCTKQTTLALEVSEAALTVLFINQSLYLIIAPYKDYICNFKWEALKFPTKRSLNELTITIQKQMHQKDEQIKKNMDEFNNMKQKIGSMTKKDTGSLTVKDFTDDIYKKHQNGDNFIGVDGSEMFTNLLLVINNEKFE